MSRFTKAAQWVCTLVPWGVSLACLIGCAQWHHFYGTLCSSILFAVTSLRFMLLVWGTWYIRAKRDRVVGRTGVIKALPWWAAVLSGYSGRVASSDHDTETYIYSTTRSETAFAGVTDNFSDAEKLRLNRHSTSSPTLSGHHRSETAAINQGGREHRLHVHNESACRKCAMILRHIAEGVLFLIVAVQTWARYSGGAAAPADWTSWSEVPACTTSNCYETNLSVNYSTTDPEKLYECTLQWMHATPRLTVEFSHLVQQLPVPPVPEVQVGDFFVRATILMVLFPFPDDMAVSLQDLTTLHVYSKSRLGKSDFGVNKNRVNAYLDSVQECAEKTM